MAGQNGYEQEGEEEEITTLEDLEASRNTLLNMSLTRSRPASPPASSSIGGGYTLSPGSTFDRSRTRQRPPQTPTDENSSLLAYSDTSLVGYRTLPTSGSTTPRAALSRQQSTHGSLRLRHPVRRGSFGPRMTRSLTADADRSEAANLDTSTTSIVFNDRVWYDQFTSTDWVRDSIADAFRVKELRSRKGFRGKLLAVLDGGKGWLLVFVVGVLTALVAYCIDVLEAAVFDYKTGFCSSHWFYSRRKCCQGGSSCEDWLPWSRIIHLGKLDNVWLDNVWLDFAFFCLWVVFLAVVACVLTLQTRTEVSSALHLSTLDEDLGADHHSTQKHSHEAGHDDEPSVHDESPHIPARPPVVYYPAAGSGVAEVKVILSGCVLHAYLGTRTLFFKSFGLVLSVASGLSIGKEGPYVHIATCIGNIACRIFAKYRDNDGKRREILSAAAAAGVAVAFGAPIGGVLFSLEEVSYYFPPKVLFRTFVCCIAAALSLRFLNPYDTGKIVLFEVRYMLDWRFFEIIVFILLGIIGGTLGALFIKASRWWAKTFRRTTFIRKHPIAEVALVAIVTGLLSFWNRFTSLPIAELLYELSAPCSAFSDTGNELCPTESRIPRTIAYLGIAFVIKAALTVVTFGIKVPAGIYVPSMVVGGIVGRIVGHAVQLLTLKYPDFSLWADCPYNGNPEACVVPGVYALVAAGATMCGVTRLSVTLAVILFELTGSLEHVLPFSLGVLTAKWTADALEPLSIYDLLTDMNAYPYLDAKVRPVFITDLGDITLKMNTSRSIDISTTPWITAGELRSKLNFLHLAGEFDGGVPILRRGVLAGIVPAPDLDFALDHLAPDDPDRLCLIDPHHPWSSLNVDPSGDDDDDDGDDKPSQDPTRLQGRSLDDENDGATPSVPHHPGITNHTTADFTSHVDLAPISLEITSPMDLVFECFVKLGLRYICVTRNGRFVGLVHKKGFVRYVKETMDQQRK